MKQFTIFKGFSTKIEDLSLDQIITDIKCGKYKKEVDLIRSEVLNGYVNNAKQLKKKLLAFTISGVFNIDRNVDNLIEYSGLLIIDIDNLTSFELIRVIPIVKRTKFTLAAFVSPSGNGLKIIVAVNSPKEDHKKAYNQVSSFYQCILNVDIDTTGSDLVRLCYMSYHSECHYNKEATIFTIQKEYEDPKLDDKKCNWNIKGDHQKNVNQSDIEKYTCLIEEKKTDITKDYNTWLKIGFALSKELGELGRDYYHRVSKFYEGYNYEECNKQYTKCLNSNGEGINIDTFYYLAHQSNIRPLKEKDIVDDNEISSPESMIVPHFPETLYPQLPEFLKKVIHHFEGLEEKDMMILSAVTVLSACFRNVFGIYDGEKVYPNLYLFITAPASAGKGKINLCKRLAYPIHKSFKDEYEQLCQEYNIALDNDEIEKSDMPNKPIIKLFFIPANSSSTGIFELIGNNDGYGLIFESEAETLANSFKTDYGNYSEGFRKAFHHETISYYRRTNKEFVDIEETCLSTVLSGTPKQVLLLTPNAENGLFSRFMFYYLKINTKWKNVFQRTYGGGLKDFFDILGDEFYTFFKHFTKEGEIRFLYTKEQEEEFSVFFTKLNSIYSSVNNGEFFATIRRMGLITFRIGMVLTALRCMETGELPKALICSDIDFRNSLEMAEVLIKHSSKVYSSLPLDKSAIKYGNKKEQFLNNLPHRFITKNFEKIASELSIPFKTAEGYITEFVQKGIIERVSRGNYQNPDKMDNEG